MPGAVVLVTAPDRVLYHDAFGKMNDAKGTPMAKDAIFNIASMTKAVTSVGVMMLVDEGRVGLDDDVAKYLPQCQNPRVISKVDLAAGTYETRPATRPITIRQLLTHTSGIGYSWSDPGLALVQKKTGAADLDLPLVNEPGAQWTYGASTRVLGQVIEKISGQTIDATSKPESSARSGCETRPTRALPPRLLASSRDARRPTERLRRSRIRPDPAHHSR